MEEYIQSITSAGGKARAAALTPLQRRRIAKKGGKASQAKLTPEERSTAASRAARARWGKKRKKG